MDRSSPIPISSARLVGIAAAVVVLVVLVNTAESSVVEAMLGQGIGDVHDLHKASVVVSYNNYGDDEKFMRIGMKVVKLGRRIGYPKVPSSPIRGGAHGMFVPPSHPPAAN
ncbi:hypothetical protein FNV43_RR02773 [Rhamnella rubrinervis]|uniref:Uncharacterized protein n=1 Tax=Rhamnella rubrinervis TaxID=2594499 RepID=A0A8K0HIG8_9ROSA|nr:hypothetical protein FNV43_RR02773 [Rhamnella rubrinervis]